MNKYYLVKTSVQEDCKVISRIIDVKEGDTIPADSFDCNKDRDIHYYWFDSYEAAENFIRILKLAEKIGGR